MNTFGKLKTKILGKLTESYSSKNKKEMKNILKSIKGNNDFREMYLFYEQIENKYFEDKEVARLFVEELSSVLKTKSKKVKEFSKTLNESLKNVEVEENEIYSILDQLSEEDTLNNIDKKVISKKKLFEHLTTKKETVVLEKTLHTNNENLLQAVLVNNFNILYNNNLTEEQKQTLKDILSMPGDVIEKKTLELKEGLNQKIDTLISESTDSEIKDKLNKVKQEVNSKKPSRINYHSLVELKNGLD
jgi:hypothetical protein